MKSRTLQETESALRSAMIGKSSFRRTEIAQEAPKVEDPSLLVARIEKDLRTMDRLFRRWRRAGGKLL